MPILISQQISIDQVSFEVTTVADAAATGTINLVSLDDTGWHVIQALTTGVPLNDAVGLHTSTFTPVVLTPGLYGIQLREPTGYNAAFRARAGRLIGPGTQALGSSTNLSPSQLPLGSNLAIISGIPVLKLRRSA
jgi:hypothetical protein